MKKTVILLVAAAAAFSSPAGAWAAAPSAPVVNSPADGAYVQLDQDGMGAFRAAFDFAPNYVPELSVRMSDDQGVDANGKLRTTADGADAKIIQVSDQGLYRADVTFWPGRDTPDFALRYWQIVYDDWDANGYSLQRVSRVQSIKLRSYVASAPMDPDPGTGSGTGSSSGGQTGGSASGASSPPSFTPADGVLPALPADTYVPHPLTFDGPSSAGTASAKVAKLSVSWPGRPQSGRVRVTGRLTSEARGDVRIELSTTKGKVKTTAPIRFGRFEKYLRVKNGAKTKSVTVRYAGSSTVLAGSATKRAAR